MIRYAAALASRRVVAIAVTLMMLTLWMRSRSQKKAAAGEQRDEAIHPSQRTTQPASTRPPVSVGLTVDVDHTIGEAKANTDRETRAQVLSQGNVRPPSTYIALLMQKAKEGKAFPKGKTTVQALLYESFLADIRKGMRRNTDIPPAPLSFSGAAPANLPRTLRVLSFNVHFWRQGFSAHEHSRNEEEVLTIVRKTRPHVLMLQEVVDVARIKAMFASLGYAHTAQAGSPDVHVLPLDQPSFAGQRLQVLILSVYPLVDTAPVDLPHSGQVAHARVMTPRGQTGQTAVDVYCVHLSVRCPPERRLAEAQAILDDWQTRCAQFGLEHVIVGGDFNQPRQVDYPLEEWEVLQRDLSAAGLPSTDGVADVFQTQGFRTSFEALKVMPPSSSAWNAALVDFMYHYSYSRTPLSVRASHLYYSSCSDHLPLITDYTM